MTVHTPHSPLLPGIKSIIFNNNEIDQLYTILRNNSELSPETISREMGTALTRLDAYHHFLSGDISNLTLSMEEVAFIIERNRYQEKCGTHNDNCIPVDIRGSFPGRKIFFISDVPDISLHTMKEIESILRDNPGTPFRLFGYRIEGGVDKSDVRILYILADDAPPSESTFSTDPDKGVREILVAKGIDVDSDTISEFVRSASHGLMSRSVRDEALIARYMRQWLILRQSVSRGEDIQVFIEDPVSLSIPERTIHLWASREKIQEHLATINRIFERRGLPFIRQYFEQFFIGARSFISMSIHLAADRLTDENAAFLQSELYNRLVLLESAPLSAGEIRDLLQKIEGMDDIEKLELIDIMQRNRQKEYLVPLIVLLNEHTREVKSRAYSLIKHYILNPTADMKNDYYWCTLKNIFSAATVPFSRERDRQPRPLSDEEIIQIIRFRSVQHDIYTEPVSGNRYMFIRMTGEGIGKGGIRAHPTHVSFSGEAALSTNMLFKTMGIGIPWYSAGKGGILGDIQVRDINVKYRGEARENVLNAYADFLYYRAGVGPLSDVPAGDVGVGGGEIGVLFNRITENLGKDAASAASETVTETPEIRRLSHNFGIPVRRKDILRGIAKNPETAAMYSAPAITGKPGPLGLALRNGATGRGLLEVLSAQQNFRDFSDAGLWCDPSRVGEALDADSDFIRLSRERIKMLTFAIQGFGKVGASFSRFIDDIGAVIMMVSDASGTLMNSRGIPGIAGLSELCAGGAKTLAEASLSLTEGSDFIPGNTVLPLTAVVNVIVPSALEDVIVTMEKPDGGHVHVKNLSCEYILQGANGPITSDAEEVLAEMGVVSFPDILANSGGVLASYMEWLNGLIGINGYTVMYRNGFVHPILHNLIIHNRPDALSSGITAVDETLYSTAFRFILRHATVAAITLSRSYRIPLRTAYCAVGIGAAAEEGRLTEKFSLSVAKMRSTFSSSLYGTPEKSS